MPRKKKFEFKYTPSVYQEKIFDFVENGSGNAVVKALAGTGKTTTAVASMQLIPSKYKVLFIAFNKSIVEELNRRLEGKKNVTVKTAHSLGYLIIKRNIGWDVEIDEYKYSTFVKNHISELSTAKNITKFTRKKMMDYVESIISLINFSRFNLANTVEDIRKISVQYDIPIKYDECEVVEKCLQWGMENPNVIDYTDMIWLPNALDMDSANLKYDWVMVDECQDMSLATIQIFMRCFKKHTRFLAIGDPNQQIYAFAGSSPEAFNFLCNFENTQVLPLPISYRCPVKVTEFANQIVPDMQHREDAPEGYVVDNCHLSMLKDGDMVLSRSRAPLVDCYVKLIRNNVKCHIKGQDLGANLIHLLQTTEKEELNPKLDRDGVFVRLYEKLFDERNALIERRGLDLYDATTAYSVMYLYDSINALLILSEKFRTKKQLIEHIETIFSDEELNGVCLSTIHKAKGLEANNIYILCHSTMPSSLAHKDWEKQEEINLAYVAYTRAKRMLGFISEKEIKPSASAQNAEAIVNDLKFIETKVCKITGKEPVNPASNVELARMNIANVTQINEEDLTGKVEETKFIAESTSKKSDSELINELLSMLE